MNFELFIVIAFHGWFAIFPIALTFAPTILIRIRHRPEISPYFQFSIFILVSQLTWITFALISTAERSISSETCLSGIFGIIALPLASVADLMFLLITAYKKQLSRGLWIKLAVTIVLFGFVAFCAALRSALLCTV